MVDDSSLSDDPGTILDSYESVLKPVPSPPAAVPPARPGSGVQEALYTSPYRWKTPRILICDDDSLDEGEIVHVRCDRITIGRTKGDIVIGHDVALSGTHAEIVRTDSGGRHAWMLRDLGSSNGTLARARAVTLRAGTTMMIGSKRYRFEEPGAGGPALESEEPGTRLFGDLASVPANGLPALVEIAIPASPNAPRHTLRNTRVTIGRPRCGNDIEIDDVCLAGTHAVVTRGPSGVWQIEAQPSLNGVWVKVDRIKLVDNCLFQCGEQRFRFRL